MEGEIKMTLKAQKRAKIVEMIKSGQLTQSTAAEKLGLSVRQVKRLCRKQRQGGDEALNHGLKGKVGNHRKSELKEKTLKIVRERFEGYKPGFISEKLSEDYKTEVKSDTLRLWMIEAGLWEKKIKRAVHRQRRQRKECFGEMLQIDGSPHDWLGTGREYCLMHIVDDATGIAYGLLDTGETTNVAMKALRDWTALYGIPHSIYSDHGGVYCVNREATLLEQLEGKKPLTEFGKVCERLGIETIFANSPQAKGRVERANGIQQDRLISELRYRGIRDLDQANEFLKKEYWAKYNKKYSKKALNDADLHVKLNPEDDINAIFCIEKEKKINNEFVVRDENILYQILKQKDVYLRPGFKVKLQKRLDGTIHIFYKEIELVYNIIKPVIKIRA